MPVSNLIHLPRPDGFKADIGGRPMPSHAYDYDLFGLMLSYHGVGIGISPGQHRHLVATELNDHLAELENQGTVDEDPYWDYMIKEIMVNNLATFYLANLVVNSLRLIAKASLAEVRPAQSTASIFNNNHMVILGEHEHAHVYATHTHMQWCHGIKLLCSQYFFVSKKSFFNFCRSNSSGAFRSN
jgi:hypothetical protein